MLFIFKQYNYGISYKRKTDHCRCSRYDWLQYGADRNHDAPHPNICLYDPYAPGLEGVAEEMFHCGFEGLNLTFTSDIKEALTDAKYVVSSGGAARKAGMTREDLLKGNAAIAEEFGKM